MQKAKGKMKTPFPGFCWWPLRSRFNGHFAFCILHFLFCIIPLALACVLLILLTHPVAAQPLPTKDLDANLNRVMAQSLERGDLPGAVVLVLHRREVVCRRAYGLRSKQPAAVPMTADTL